MDDQQAREAAAKALFVHDVPGIFVEEQWGELRDATRQGFGRSANAVIDTYLSALHVAPEQPTQASDTLVAALGRLERLYAGVSLGQYIVTEETMDEDVWVREELRLLRAEIGLGFLPDVRDALLVMRAYASLVSSPSVETVAPDREWGVEYGPMRAVNQFSTREECDRFIANPPMWSTPAHRYEPVVVHRRPAGPWERAL